MTKMASIDIYGKILKNSSFQEPVRDFDETWYEALETQAYYILYK